jgi:hypothetical protein
VLVRRARAEPPLAPALDAHPRGRDLDRSERSRWEERRRGVRLLRGGLVRRRHGRRADRLRDGRGGGHRLAARARAQQLVLRRLARQIAERARELADQVGLDGGGAAALVLGQQRPGRGRDLPLDGPREGVGRVVEEHAAA